MTIDWLANRMEYWRRRYVETNNPMCVWEAIREARGRFTGEKISLPDWCNDYLEGVADQLRVLQGIGTADALSETPEVRKKAWSAAKDEIPAALGFTRQGWNAMQGDVSDEKKHRAAARFQVLTKAEGRRSAEAYRIMRDEDEWKGMDERTLRDLIATGRVVSSLPK